MKLAIIGAGESGLGAARLAKSKGHDVFLSDKGSIDEETQWVLKELGVEWESGSHDEQRILASDEIIKSPGVPDEAPLIQKAFDKGISVISEIEFASRYTHAFTIGITGSNGKTTTTLLTWHIMNHAGLDVGLAGNIGTSMAGLIAERDPEYLVLELSSFQLDGIKNFRPNIAILLNITPDHLDRYAYDFNAYAQAKMNICMNQREGDHFIYNADDPEISGRLSQVSSSVTLHPFSLLTETNSGAFATDAEIIIKSNTNQKQNTVMSLHEIALKGKHNTYNTMASSIASSIVGIRKENIRESLSDFKNIPHRLQNVGLVNGIEFINDSKATNINSTWYALDTLSGPMVWIVGGVDKGNNYQMIERMVAEKVKAIVCLGKDNKKIIDAFEDIIEPIETALSAEEAVKKAYYLARPGEKVLLSPACASFDLFKSYEDRGNQFMDAVKSL